MHPGKTSGRDLTDQTYLQTHKQFILIIVCTTNGETVSGSNFYSKNNPFHKIETGFGETSVRFRSACIGFHQDNTSVYSKTGVCRGIHIFALKHTLWVLVRTTLARRF